LNGETDGLGGKEEATNDTNWHEWEQRIRDHSWDSWLIVFLERVMSLSGQLHVALKEWAVVCAALEEGRQIMLLRKGGIHETGGRFELEHPKFSLFPTYLHQNKEMLKPSEHARFVAATAEPERITMSAAGEVTDIIQLKSRGQMDALEDQHVWTRPLIDMRFNYRPENPLYLMLVRVYRLAGAVVVENTPAYAGCKSWVPLTEAIRVEGARAVVGEGEYEERRGVIMERLKKHA
jgi:hypothetical protein